MREFKGREMSLHEFSCLFMRDGWAFANSLQITLARDTQSDTPGSPCVRWSVLQASLNRIGTHWKLLERSASIHFRGLHLSASEVCIQSICILLLQSLFRVCYRLLQDGVIKARPDQATHLCRVMDKSCSPLSKHP